MRTHYLRAAVVAVAALSVDLCSAGVPQHLAMNSADAPSIYERFIAFFSRKPPFGANEDVTLSVLSSAEQKRAFEHASQVVQLRKQPGEWDATVFLPTTAMTELLATALHDVTLEVPGVEAIIFRIKDVNFRAGYGAGEVALEMQVRTHGERELGTLIATGTLLYAGFAPVADGSAKASFFIAIKALQPKRGGEIAALLGKGLGIALTSAFKDHLRVEIPIPAALRFDARYVEENPEDWQRLKTARGGEVRVKLEARGATVTAAVNFVAALFVPDGVWIAASQDRLAPLPAPRASELKEALEPYRSAATRTPHVNIKGDAIANALNTAASAFKTEESRTLHAYAVSRTGDLYSETWRDNTLGRGGTRVRLARAYDFAEKSGPKASVTVRLKEPVGWTEAGELRLVLGYKVTGGAPLEVHIDPSVSGGMGTTVGCNVKSGPERELALRARLQVQDAPGGAQALAIRAQLEPHELPLEFATDGKFKVGDMKLAALGGWTKIPGFTISLPQVGVIVTLPLGPDTLPPLSIMNNAPHRVGLFDPKPDSTGPRLRIENGDRYLALAPKTAIAGRNGVRVDCDIAVFRMTQQQADERAKAVKAALTSKQKFKMPKPARIEVSVGDLAFGRNNELAKLLAALFKGVDEVAGAAKQAGKEVEKEVSRAGQELENAVHQAKRDPPKAVESFFQQRAKDVSKAGETLDNARRYPLRPDKWFE